MNFRFIFGILLTIEVVLSNENRYECARKRKSGACKAFNVTEDFDHFIELDVINSDAEYSYRISTIIEIDYAENKDSYEQEKIKKIKKFDTDDNPVVEILFSEEENPEYSYRLEYSTYVYSYLNQFSLMKIVLGEKINRLAYVEVIDEYQKINYNNYSPELPSWPFVINVTVDGGPNLFDSKLNVYTHSDDGFQATPFLRAKSEWIKVKYMSFRSRNKNVKLIGFYDCSMKYGRFCGTEKTQIITDCREKFSPLGSGFYNNFVKLSRFNRLGINNTEKFEFNEIFGVYRRNNDNMQILFSEHSYESGAYIRITIGEEIVVRARNPHYGKTAFKNEWNQEPYDPNFIKVQFSSVTKQISIFKLDDEEPLLTMKLCGDFDLNKFIYMSVTSNRFKSVELYYDCCKPNKLEDCHVYERNYTETNNNDDITTESNQDYPKLDIRFSNEDITDSTTIRLDEESTTLESNGLDTTMLSENDKIETTMDPTEITMQSMEATVEPTEITMQQIDTTVVPTEITTESEKLEVNSSDYDENEEVLSKIRASELKTLLKGINMTRTFLDRSDFHKVNDTQYIYENGNSTNDYCHNEIADVNLTQNAEVVDNKVDEDDAEVSEVSGLSSSLLKALIG